MPQLRMRHVLDLELVVAHASKSSIMVFPFYYSEKMCDGRTLTLHKLCHIDDELLPNNTCIGTQEPRWMTGMKKILTHK